MTDLKLLPDVLDADGENWYFNFEHPLSNIHKLACRDYAYDPWEIMDIAENVAAQFNTKYGNDPHRSWGDRVDTISKFVVTYEEALVTSTASMAELASDYACSVWRNSKGVYANSDTGTNDLSCLVSALSWLYLRGEDIQELMLLVQKTIEDEA